MPNDEVSGWPIVLAVPLRVASPLDWLVVLSLYKLEKHMATVFDVVGIKGLRLTHFNQLLSYIEHNQRDDGYYYGNKEQFLKRENELSEWLQDIIDHASSNDVVIPKK